MPLTAGRDRPALEIVRFEVPVRLRGALLDGHLPARRAIRKVAPPGAAWSRLVELGGSRWIEVVAWEQRSTFDRALELSQDDPTARGWFDLAEPGFTITIAGLERLPSPPPPRQGRLEVAPDLDQPQPRGGEIWSVLAETDGPILVDPAGWVGDRGGTIRLSVTPGSASPATSEWAEEAESGEIVDSIDAPQEEAPAR